LNYFIYVITVFVFYQFQCHLYVSRLKPRFSEASRETITENRIRTRTEIIDILAWNE